MPLNIKNSEADRLARELAELTGESITDAVVEALEQRLAREHVRRGRHALRVQLRRIQQRIAEQPELDKRAPDEILGYDENGLPT